MTTPDQGGLWYAVYVCSRHEKKVHRLFQDDLDTAFRHMDLYDRFGCPGGHIQAAFRCVVKQGPIVDAKAQENILARVHSCWVNPAAPPAPSAAATTPQTGTTTQ